MKNSSVIIVLALAAALLFGGCTVTESTSEHFSRIYTSNSLQLKMMMEDIDALLLLNKPEYSSTWTVRGGLPN